MQITRKRLRQIIKEELVSEINILPGMSDGDGSVSDSAHPGDAASCCGPRRIVDPPDWWTGVGPYIVDSCGNHLIGDDAYDPSGPDGDFLYSCADQYRGDGELIDRLIEISDEAHVAEIALAIGSVYSFPLAATITGAFIFEELMSDDPSVPGIALAAFGSAPSLRWTRLRIKELDDLEKARPLSSEEHIARAHLTRLLEKYSASVATNIARALSEELKRRRAEVVNQIDKALAGRARYMRIHPERIVQATGSAFSEALENLRKSSEPAVIKEAAKTVAQYIGTGQLGRGLNRGGQGITGSGWNRLAENIRRFSESI